MKYKIHFKDIITWILIIVPFIYLYSILSELPDTVATHFDMEGNPNGWSNKNTLWFIPTSMGLFTYLLMLIIPRIDPKKRLQEMGSKYKQLNFIIFIFISILSLYILYIIKNASFRNPNIVIGILGGMFLVLGNYFQTIRPNYFIGIRTPWTLESEIVWKETHSKAGYLWMLGGTVVIICAFTLQNKNHLNTIFISIVALISLIPIIHSYILFKQTKKQI